MAEHFKVANVADLPPGEATLVTAGEKRVALFNVGGTCHALDDTCTHRGGPLSEGTLDGDVVTCPWHGARFCVRDGRRPGPPGSRQRHGVPGAGHRRQHRDRGLRLFVSGP